MIIRRRVVRRPPPPNFRLLLDKAKVKGQRQPQKGLSAVLKTWSKEERKKSKMAYDGFTDEYRIVAYFIDVYPSPTTYKRRTYETLKDAERDFPKALEFYRSKPYTKHLESVSIECRQVGPWRWIGD